MNFRKLCLQFLAHKHAPLISIHILFCLVPRRLFVKNSDAHMTSLHEVLQWGEMGEAADGKSALELRDAWQFLVDFLQQSTISCKL